MSPVSEAIFLGENGLSSRSGHKIAAAIDDNGEPENGVLLPLLLSQIACGSCLLSHGGVCITLAPRLSGGVCVYA